MLERVVSSARLRSYRPADHTELDMIVNYYWNTALSEALHPSLAALEVSLRNSIHHALTDREGTEMWFTRLPMPRELRSYANVYMDLERRLRSNPAAGQIVAELNFGFWVSLLNKTCFGTLWSPDRAALVHTAFPNMPRIANPRQHAFERYDPLRALRNRVMHYEPIWNGFVWKRIHRPIAELHTDVIEAIGWVSRDFEETVRGFDRFPVVYDPESSDRIEKTIKTQLGIL